MVIHHSCCLFIWHAATYTSMHAHAFLDARRCNGMAQPRGACQNVVAYYSSKRLISGSCNSKAAAASLAVLLNLSRFMDQARSELEQCHLAMAPCMHACASLAQHTLLISTTCTHMHGCTHAQRSEAAACPHGRAQHGTAVWMHGVAFQRTAAAACLSVCLSRLFVRWPPPQYWAH